MKVARILRFGDSPSIVDEAQPPPPTEIEIQLRVIAVGIHQLVRLRAAGTHYSARGLPHIPGVDGIGEDTSNPAKKYYFGVFAPKGGSMQEIVNVDRSNAVLLADEIPHDVLIGLAATMNPLMASWMGLAKRIDWNVVDRDAGFTVLIIGVTGYSGRIAVPTARRFGATRVIGCARSTNKSRDLDLDAFIELAEDAKNTDFSVLSKEANHVDVVLDFLYGDPAIALFQTISAHKPVQYVQIGSIAGPDIRLPAAAIRSKDLTIRGTGPGSWQISDFLLREASEMASFLISNKSSIAGAKEIKFVEVADRWEDSKERMVVVI